MLIDYDVVILDICFFSSLELSQVWISLHNGKKICSISHTLSPAQTSKVSYVGSYLPVYIMQIMLFCYAKTKAVSAYL